MPDYVVAGPPPDEYAPIISFDLFMSHVFDWGQDEHVAVIGPTGQGKTNLIYHLLQLRSYVAYLCIKAQDKTLDAFAGQSGYQRLHDWPPKSGKGPFARDVRWSEMPKRLVWPDARDRTGAIAVQQRVFRAALDDVWANGNCCVVWDDFWYMVNVLRMEIDAKQNLMNARSINSPQVFAAQRGAGNRMVELFDQPSWLFFAKETDPRNLQLIGRPSTPEYGFVSHLDRFQFLVKNIRTGHMWRTTAPELSSH